MTHRPLFVLCARVGLVLSVLFGVASSPALAQTPAAPPPTSPLAIHVGDSDFVIGGFMDLTAFTRSTNTGTGISSSFGTIPFTNLAGVPQAAGNLSETRFTTQNSRISLQATSKVGGASLKGYVGPTSSAPRPDEPERHQQLQRAAHAAYWVQQAGKFEFLGGQSWSMLTPGRNASRPCPAICSTARTWTQLSDGPHVGRTPQFRFVAHASSVVTAAVAPRTRSNTSAARSCFLPRSPPQKSTTAPTAAPRTSIRTSSARSPRPEMGNGTHQHIEGAVLVRGYKTYNPATDSSFTSTATGGSVNVVLEPVKNFKIVGTTFFSNGGGRYVANTNLPDFIVNADESLSLVKSRSFIVGPEIQAGPKSLIFGYYSQAMADSNVAVDTNGKQIGFGVTGSTSANNKVTEATVGLVQTFFRDPKIGGCS